MKSIVKNETAPVSRTDSMETQTIIGEDISITGEIHGKGDLLIKGSVKGKIELENGHVTVGSKGQVEAEIRA